MNMLDKDFQDVESGMEKLREAVSLRNQMGGDLYWNILNDDCNEIADKLVGIGANPKEVWSILR